MKVANIIPLLLAAALLAGISCTKDHSCENCPPPGRDSLPAPTTNQPPIARAGWDQHRSLPLDTVLLDGSGSSDADGRITTYRWIQLDGTVPVVVVRPDSAQTGVRSLVAGVYHFTLTVTDNQGATDTDTLQLTVDNATAGANTCDISARPLVSARLVPLGQLSQTRAEVAVAATGGKIIFAGGYRTGGVPSSRVDIWDAATATWSTAELSGARYNLATAVLGNRVFFAGGDEGEPGRHPSNRVDIWEAAANRWTTAKLSEARTGIAAAAAGTKVVFAGGGLRIDGHPGNSTRADIYDAALGTWYVNSLLPGQEPGGFGIAATVVGTKIYFAGGASDWYAPQTGGIYTNAINVYDAATGNWTLDVLNNDGTFDSERGGMAAIAVGSKVFWAGGREGEFAINRKPSNKVEIRDYDAKTEVFDCLFQPNPQPTAVRSGSRIVIFTTHTIQDGWLLPGVVTNKFDIYDLATHSWSIGVLPVDIYNASVVSWNDTIYVAGGIVNGRPSSLVWKLEF